MVDKSVGLRKQRLAAIEKCLKELGHEYQSLDDGGFVIKNVLYENNDQATENEDSHALIVLERGMVFLTDLSIEIPKECTEKVALALHFINDNLPYGNFELTRGGKEISFKVSTFFSSKTPIDIDTSIQDCIATTRQSVSSFKENIKRVISGSIAPEDSAITED